MRKLRRIHEFGKPYTYSVEHSREREPENARYHVTNGQNTLEVTFRYVKG